VFHNFKNCGEKGHLFDNKFTNYLCCFDIQIVIYRIKYQDVINIRLPDSVEKKGNRIGNRIFEDFDKI
jgi:hypothetical protein